MADRPPANRASFILTIWQQGDAVWRGFVESPAGERHYFASLSQLSSLMAESGWQDALLKAASPESQPNLKQEQDP